MGSRSRPHRVLSVCVCVCVSRCVWLRLIRSSWESSPLGYISSCHALPLVRSLQFAVDVYEAFLVPGFRDSWALLLSWTPIAGDSSAHCFPALPASAPTESSVSAYGKLRVCLRKLRPSAYGKLRLVSRCVLLLVINSLFPQLNPPVFIVTMHAYYLKSIKGYSTLLEVIGCEGNSLLLDGNCIHHHALHCAWKPRWDWQVYFVL